MPAPGRSCPKSEPLHRPCRSGLVSRKGRIAAPAIFALVLISRGCFAPLSRHKAAPTGTAQAFRTLTGHYRNRHCLTT
ncbi:hypothetical protein DMX06_20485 [Pseudomonas mosselii]|nr:hypothetical protein DMX06_20485 [Pseudomonas mosselii]